MEAALTAQTIWSPDQGAQAPAAFIPSVTASVLAGAGEELLFRGALQPWVGISLASVLFSLLYLAHVLP